MTYSYDNNNGAPSLSVSTADILYIGIYTVVVTGSVNTSPVTYADSTLTFSMTMSDDACVLTRLLDPGIADISYTIDSHEAPFIRSWDEFTDVEGDYDAPSGSSCGSRLYDYPDRYTAAWIADPTY